MSTIVVGGEWRTLLQNVSWLQYVELRDADENRNKRTTYDRRSFELLARGRRHERISILIDRSIFIWAQEKQVLIWSYGSMTHCREDLARGLEPDKCYYFHREPVMSRDREFDLTIDPPVDLAVDVDVTSNSIDRMPIYAAFGVPEFWRWCGDELLIFRLSADRQYRCVELSDALPGFPAQEMVRLILPNMFYDDVSYIRQFRDLCRAKK